MIKLNSKPMRHGRH